MTNIHSETGWTPCNAKEEKLSNVTSSIIQRVWSRLNTHSSAWPFLTPVNTDIAPDYYQFIKYPMDLQTVGARITKGYYITRSMFIADVNRIFNNCRLYNDPSTDYYKSADTLQKYFISELKEAGMYNS